MITNLNPLLKQHVETYMDDIEKGDLTQSIVCCPIDVMQEYLDTLRMIDEVIPGHLIPFTRMCCCLASFLHGGQLVKTHYRSTGDETYTFEFPVQLMDSQRLRNDLIHSCPDFCLTVDIGYSTSMIEVKVSIQHASKFMF